jgi:hypothetical protein
LDPTLKYFTTDGSASAVQIKCGSEKWTLAEFQSRGFELGSTVSAVPGPAEVVKWGEDLLRLP